MRCAVRRGRTHSHPDSHTCAKINSLQTTSEPKKFPSWVIVSIPSLALRRGACAQSLANILYYGIVPHTNAQNGVFSPHHTDLGVIIPTYGLTTPNINPTNVVARSWVSVHAPEHGFGPSGISGVFISNLSPEFFQTGRIGSPPPELQIIVSNIRPQTSKNSHREKMCVTIISEIAPRR